MCIRDREFTSEDWQAAYDFLKAGENEVSNADKCGGMPDGIYVCYEDGYKAMFDGTNSKQGVSHIGIIMGEHSIGIALNSLGEQSLPRNREFDDENEWDNYQYGEIPALDDFRGKENTAHLKLQGDFSFSLKDNEWIPSLGELALIFRNKKRVNEALRYVGGTELPNSWHWSSTELSATYAWYLGFSNGSLNGNVKPFTNVVRAVCAF